MIESPHTPLGGARRAAVVIQLHRAIKLVIEKTYTAGGGQHIFQRIESVDVVDRKVWGIMTTLVETKTLNEKSFIRAMFSALVLMLVPLGCDPGAEPISDSLEPLNGGASEGDALAKELEEAPSLDEDVQPDRDAPSSLSAESEPSTSTACGGADVHDHGNDLFPAVYQVTMGCDCSPGMTRDYYEYFNTGHGSCNPIGWESPDPTDCRVRMEIHRSGGFANGHCNLIVEEGLAGDCFSANSTMGCEDPAITSCVCAMDSYCCYVTWDWLCASEATSFGC